MDSYSLKEVNEYIKQVISMNFEDSIWIDAEISQVKEVRGQVYLEFVQKAEDYDKIIAKAQGIIWYKSLLFIRKKLGELLDTLLQEGIQIRFKAKPEFHEIYGLKFTLEDIDPAYTLGTMEINRQKIIERLKKENLLYKNKETVLPLVIKKIAVISSSKAAGLQDFIKQLQNNPYGYKYVLTLLDSSMQGYNVERDIIRNLETIEQNHKAYDCVVIIRGGGSKMDLAYFDNYNISVKVANFPIPVLTGIGHDVDQNVIELVAHTALKTPTAVADFILDRNLNFESRIIELFLDIKDNALKKLKDQELQLNRMAFEIKEKASNMLSEAKYNTEHLYSQIINSAKELVYKEKNKLNEMEYQLRLSDPSTVLKKGYTLTLKDGKIIKSITDLEKDERITTMFADGKVKSIITDKNPD